MQIDPKSFKLHLAQSLNFLGQFGQEKKHRFWKQIEVVIFKTKKAELEHLKFLILSLQVT